MCNFNVRLAFHNINPLECNRVGCININTQIINDVGLEPGEVRQAPWLEPGEVRQAPCGKKTFVSISRHESHQWSISAFYSTLHSYGEVQSIRVACVLLLDRQLASCVCKFVYCWMSVSTCGVEFRPSV